jgi:hypothetical protein
MRQSVIQGQLEEISNAKDLDESLRDILIQLNEAGYCTGGSCSGYRWEHCEKEMFCDLKPFITIMTRSWEAKKMVSKLKQNLLGTYWDVTFRKYPSWFMKDGKKNIIGYYHNVFYEEKYDSRYCVIGLTYKRDLSDKQIKRGWDILLSKLVGD